MVKSLNVLNGTEGSLFVPRWLSILQKPEWAAGSYDMNGG